MSETSDALRDLAAAIRELALAMRPAQSPEPEYRCERCGSPRWEAGGQAEMFKQCTDCAYIGEKIEA